MLITPYHLSPMIDRKFAYFLTIVMLKANAVKSKRKKRMIDLTGSLGETR